MCCIPKNFPSANAIEYFSPFFATVITAEARSGHTLVPVLLTLVAAGGISNLIDRFTLGYVTDMISCGNFAVFNVADIAVTCGCVLTMLALLLFYREEEED